MFPPDRPCLLKRPAANHPASPGAALTLIPHPHNNALTFAGGVGDPSAVTAGDYRYLFYGEYGYPGNRDSDSYDPVKEWKGQSEQSNLPAAGSNSTVVLQTLQYGEDLSECLVTFKK